MTYNITVNYDFGAFAAAAQASATEASGSADAAAASAVAADTSADAAAASAVDAAAELDTALLKANNLSDLTSKATARLYLGPWLDDVTALLANTSLTYTAAQPTTVVAGDIVRTRAEGFSYEVAASGATDQHVTTAGGVKLYVLPGGGAYNLLAFGAPTDGSNAAAAIQLAWATGGDVVVPGGYTFTVTATTTITSTSPRRVTGSGKIKQGANDINCIDASGAQNVIIDGVEFEGYAATAAGTDFAKSQAVYANGGRNITVQNCVIHGFSQNGIQLRNVFMPRVEGNLLYNNYYDSPSGSDIVLYSNTDGSGAIIWGNRCHSNNSQAIYVNAIGGDRDVLIEGNICHTLDASDWSEITDYSAAAGTQRNSATLLQRRHGIMFGYASAANLPGRFIIANNNIRSTQWSGIYRAVSSFDPGPATVTGNVMSNVSMQNGASGSLEGGFLILCCGAGDIYDGNQIFSVGNGNQNKAGIKFVPSAGFPGSVRFTKNTIKTAGMGIWLGGFLPESIIVSENDLYDFHQRGGIYYAPTNQNTTINAHVVMRDNLTDGFNGSTFDRAAIYLDTSVAAITVPQIIEVDGGSIRARADTSYFGVVFRGLAITDTLAIGGGIAIDGTENAIWCENFAVGRFPALRLGRVMVRNSRNRAVCEAFNMGYGGAGSAFAIVEAGGGVYEGVTNVVDNRGGFKALYQGRWLDNDRAEVVHTGIPTNGCWVRGDRVLYSGPAAASAPGAVCVTSGQFGTISGVTAATTSGSASVTFSAVTALAVGMFITIAGVSGTKRIVSLSGTNATVDTACDATVAAGAVAYVTPVFKTMASISA